MKANGTDVVELQRAVDCLQRGNFMNGRSPAREYLPADARFTPQVEVSVKTYEDSSNGTAALENQYKGRIAEQKQTDQEFQSSTQTPIQNLNDIQIVTFVT